MKNKVKIMKEVSDNLSKKFLDKQEKNRLWWESLPMTYEDWDDKDRLPKTKEAFLKIEKEFLDGNPFIRDEFNFEKLRDKLVLEIGCGSGAASCLFAKSGVNVVSVDITENGVNITKENARIQNLKLKVLQEDAENLSFPAGTFDFVFSWGVLHHSKNTLKAFGEVKRVLKKGGGGLIMVYNKNSLRYYINGLYWLLLRGKIFRGYNLERVQDFYTDGFYHRHFRPNELEKELEKIGLRVKRISITHMGTRMIPFFPRRVVDWMKRRWGWLLVAEFEK